ncbi:YfhO family protein [Lactobacillus sp. PV012]|uniref:YfhO family protein n=1 Tax=Lactobacillus sp. PV012 TaxID=2594494 RepID=UPI00223F9328|nr:YfhO family protein [Lactobacillus sp. PV012]QNQ82015.1 YfhO family protein [Lactobacillus sp. PV012]
MTKTRRFFIYLLSFILPSFIFFTYFYFRKMDILTVDLGQQYIDFLAYFKTNFFHSPLKLIYSLSKGLGGSMIGTDAYYLNSPLNLILLLFPTGFLPQATLLLISLKIGLAGLTSYFLWQRKFQTTGKFFALAASLAYALSGYMLANNLNLMWLDSVILLPLLIYSLQKILKNQKNNHLLLITFLLWFTNFYTGYMALLFGFLYFISNLFGQKISSPFQKILIYFKKSILATLLASFTLVPTVVELLQGKTNVDSQFNWNFQFMPWNIFTKFEIGSYSFTEMEKGFPNIFLTSTFLILAILYFTSQSFSKRQKFFQAGLLLFLLLSLSFNPLILLWHMGQFPVWYPGRFSFVLIFYLLDLGIQLLQRQHYFKVWQKILTDILLIALMVFWSISKNQFEFMSNFKFELSVLFLICVGLLITFYNYQWAKLFIFGLVGIEVTINLIFSLNEISYQNNFAYSNTTNNLTRAVNYLNQKDTSLFRIEKNFDRSENDSLSNNYYGIGHFNSISDSKTISFVRALGLKSNDNSFSNNYSTLVTDSILGIKYYLLPNSLHWRLPVQKQLNLTETYERLDFNQDPFLKNIDQIQIRKNPAALPLFFTINSNKKFSLKDGDPIYNQTNLLYQILGRQTYFYSALAFPKPILRNSKAWKNSWHVYSTVNKKFESSVSFTLIPSTNDPYYLELPSYVDKDSASLIINGKEIDTSDLGSGFKLINLTSRHKNHPIHITFNLKDHTLDLSTARLWTFDTQHYLQVMKQYLQKQPTIYQTSALSLKFNYYSVKNTTFASTLPYSKNWLIFDNGQRVPAKLWHNTFLSFNLAKGKHQITLIYIPYPFLIGSLISLMTLISILVFRKHAKKRRSQ